MHSHKCSILSSIGYHLSTKLGTVNQKVNFVNR